jgi:predicted Zn finger-like uncharacterized protein
MIIVCHECSARLQIDDAKYSTRHFTVRCPKCNSEVHSSSASTVDPNASAAVNRFTYQKPAPLFELDSEVHANANTQPAAPDQLTALLSGLMSVQGLQTEQLNLLRPSWNPRRALVCIPEEQREGVARNLAQHGYQVFVAEDTRQAIERMRENQLDVVVIDPRFDPGEQGFVFVTREVNILRPTQRRRMFLVLLSPQLRTMDAHAAFINNVNVIVNLSDLGELPGLIENRLRDYNELYKEFNQALKIHAL